MIPRPLPAAALLVALALASDAAAGDPLVFDGAETTTVVQQGWEQRWGKVAVDPRDGSFVCVWSTVVGHNLKLRWHTPDGAPVGGELLVNETLNAGRQDEPMAAFDDAGNLFVCWSDREGHDGFQMGVFGRVFGPDRQPLGPEFQISEAWQQSQWEPMPEALPGGGWVVAFNGDDDGEAYLRFLDTDGTPRTGDVSINTFDNNGQTEAEVAVSRDGVVLAVYADFGANVQAGTGTNLLARRFTLAGVALDPLEWVVNDGTLPFDQLEPRLAASRLPSGQGVFVMVWEDWGHDGDGAGIFARWYSTGGVPLGPEFQVNTSTAGDQRLPEVAVDHVGNTVITWEDNSTTEPRIVARAYGGGGAPLTGEVVVSGSEGAAGKGYSRPQVAVDPQGEHWVLAYGGPGATDAPSFEQDRDVWLRRAPRPILDQLTAAATGSTAQLALDMPGAAGDFYLVGAALSGLVGLPLPDGRVLPLDLDPLFQQALLFPDNGLPFLAFQGVLGLPAETTVGLVIPPNPNLIGLPLRVAALSADLGLPGLANQLRHVSHPRTITIE